jgi:mannosyltransferase OCH1-like enzyme
MTSQHWDSLASRPFDTIDQSEQAPLFDAGRYASAKLEPREAVTPLRVFQYWNEKTPDSQVAELFTQTRRHCEQDGIDWRVFSEESAAAFLRDTFGKRHEAAFWKCVHHAQRSAFFRYSYLWSEGGMWLDADLALFRSPRPLLSFDRPVFFQRLSKSHRQLTNWLMIAPPNHPILNEIVGTCLRNLENDAYFSERIAVREVASAARFTGKRLRTTILPRLCRISFRAGIRTFICPRLLPPAQPAD